MGFEHLVFTTLNFKLWSRSVNNPAHHHCYITNAYFNFVLGAPTPTSYFFSLSLALASLSWQPSVLFCSAVGKLQWEMGVLDLEKCHLWDQFRVTVVSTASAEVTQSTWIKYCSVCFLPFFFDFALFLHGSVISIQHIAAFLKLTVMELMNSSSWIPKDLVFCNLIGNRVALNKLSLSFHMSTQLCENWEGLLFLALLKLTHSPSPLSHSFGWTPLSSKSFHSKMIWQ